MLKIINAIKSVIEEVRKVEWLSRKELLRYSFIVLTVTTITTILVALIDVGLILGRGYLLEIL